MLTLITVLLISCYIGVYFLRFSFYPKVYTYDELIQDELERKAADESLFEEIKSNFFKMETQNGYELNCVWLDNEDSSKTVILVHGYTNNLMGSVRYIEFFKKRGFNILLYDQRYHGLSGGKNTTFGYYEKYDLLDVIKFVKDKVGERSIIGLHGESMGASTILQVAPLTDDISFIVADCAFSDLETQFSNRLKADFKLPKYPVIPIAKMITFVLEGVPYNKVSPIRVVQEIKVPTLFIHGDSDQFTDVSQSLKMFDLVQSKKSVYIARGADHAQSVLVNRQKYDEEIGLFLKEAKV